MLDSYGDIPIHQIGLCQLSYNDALLVAVFAYEHCSEVVRHVLGREFRVVNQVIFQGNAQKSRLFPSFPIERSSFS